jgi:phosphatidyl-myo-inositol dimannoside synthase
LGGFTHTVSGLFHEDIMQISSHSQFDRVDADRIDSAAAPLFVFLEIFEREGGIQSYVQDIFRSYSSFAERSADVFLLRDGRDCANPFAKPFGNSPLNFHYFKHRSAKVGRLWMAIALFWQILKNRPSRVFCGHVNLAPLVRWLCQPFRIPYTVMVHGKEVWEPLSPALRTALQEADEIWTVSRYSRDRSAASNQLDVSKMRLMPCAVDGDRFSPGEKSAALMERYGLADAKVMVTVARLWSGDIYKGVDMTIRALGAIAAAIPDVKYLVIGRGDDQPRLARLAAELGVGDRVVFAGFVATAELPEHYRLADAYVMPSQEGFGIVYLEAMACGVPVLAGDADGSADPLQDGALGWRVPHRDAGAIASACIEMLQPEGAGQERRNREWLRGRSLELFGQGAFTRRLRDALSDRGEQ